MDILVWHPPGSIKTRRYPRIHTGRQHCRLGKINDWESLLFENNLDSPAPLKRGLHNWQAWGQVPVQSLCPNTMKDKSKNRKGDFGLWAVNKILWTTTTPPHNTTHNFLRVQAGVHDSDRSMIEAPSTPECQESVPSPGRQQGQEIEHYQNKSQPEIKIPGLVPALGGNQ